MQLMIIWSFPELKFFVDTKEKNLSTSVKRKKSVILNLVS